jgi:phosphatidylethanolamine/phosphatidyl-N-methylethanolamine N-methyltransferase
MGDIDREGVEKAYGRWAPVYDLVFGKVFDAGRQSTIAEADRIGGRILDVGVGTGLSLSDYAPSTRVCGVDISEPMLRRAQQRVRAQRLDNVEPLAVRRTSRSRTPHSMRWSRNMSSPRCPIPKARSTISSAC